MSDELLNRILLLGDSRLYEPSAAVRPDEWPDLAGDIGLLHELILAFRRKYGVGRGIAAPQIGLRKRVICLNLDGRQHTLINPEFRELSREKMKVWDDCMCFPGWLVQVERHASCRLEFRDKDWSLHSWSLEGDLSELLQHECDHLDGILATQRAIDNRSFRLKPTGL